jgi:AcrR family transcriptional regulator
MKGKTPASTRERLLDVAARLFADRGYDGVSVRDIVGQAGANLGAVTYHFGSKEALFGEVLTREIQPLLRAGREIVESDAAPAEKLRRMLRDYALYVLHEKPGLKVLFSEMLAGGERLPAAAVEAVRWRNRAFADVVEQGVREGDFRPCDVECAAWSFFGMLSAYILYDPLVRQHGAGGAFPREYVERVLKTALDLFLNGLRVRRSEGDGADGG